MDLYPEYTGTALTAILNEPPQNDPAAVFSARSATPIASAFTSRSSPPLGFNNTFAIVVRGEDAGNLHLHDDFRHGSLRAEMARRFRLRIHGAARRLSRLGDGLRPEFVGEPRIMDLGLLYRALQEKQVDVVAGNSTDGLIAALGMVVLEDDRHYFPPYQAVPWCARATFERHPEAARRARRARPEKFPDDEMRAMNYAVDGQHRDSRDRGSRRFSKGAGGCLTGDAPPLPAVNCLC